jgi:hypothetical protein
VARGRRAVLEGQKRKRSNMSAAAVVVVVVVVVVVLVGNLFLWLILVYSCWSFP